MPAPSNDDFANAIALSTSLPNSRTGDTNVDATSETGEPIVFFTSITDQTVWYTFTPTSTGRYAFRIRNATSGYNDVRLAVIAIFSGSAVNALTPIAEDLVPTISTNDGSLHPGAGITADLSNGVTYYIRVGSPISSGDTANDHTINYDLEWDEVSTAAPANDDLDDAEDLGTDPPDGSTAGTTRGGSAEVWEDGDGYVDPSVWYRFASSTTTTREIHVVRANGDPDWRPYYEVYEILNDPPADFTDLQYIDGGGFTAPGTSSSDSVNTAVAVEAGKDYVIFVTPYEVGAGHQDDFTLWFGAPPPAGAPDNDDFDSVESQYNIFNNSSPYRIDKSIYGNYSVYKSAAKISGTTTDASSEALEPAHASYGPTRSVWYLYRTYFSDMPRDYKVWVESSVDCVLSVYRYDPVLRTDGGDLGDLESLGEDDDSGPGDNPELIFTDDSDGNGSNYYWICVDSKTEGDFDLFLQRQPLGIPPANDNFEDAEVHTAPFAVSGTTVNGTGEPEEYESDWQGIGPSDGVWYKYTPNYTGTAIIGGRCLTFYDDAYVFIHVFEGSDLGSLTLVSTDSENDGSGQLFWGDGEWEYPLYFPVVASQDYYIRVASWSGGSEDFEIYVDTYYIPINIEVSGTEEMHGTLLDDAEIYINIEVSGVDEYHAPTETTDAATIYVDIKVSGSEEFHGTFLDAADVYMDLRVLGTELQADEYVDSDTIYMNIRFLGGECYSTNSGEMIETEAWTRWSTNAYTLLSTEAYPQWSAGEIQVEGVVC